MWIAIFLILSYFNYFVFFLFVICYIFPITLFHAVFFFIFLDPLFENHAFYLFFFWGLGSEPFLLEDFCSADILGYLNMTWCNTTWQFCNLEFESVVCLPELLTLRCKFWSVLFHEFKFLGKNGFLSFYVIYL